MESFTLQLPCQAIAASSTEDGTTTAAPAARSAHCYVLGPDGALYLTCGDSGTAGLRFSDLWRRQEALCMREAAGNAAQGLVCASRATAAAVHSCVQRHCTQRPQACTARSNAAAAAAGDWLVLFGGWCSTGLEPLAQLEAFCFSTETWHTPHPSGTAPSPRGQPAAAANSAGTDVYYFGGWDGSRRYNDLFKLHVPRQQEQDGGWAWELVQPQPAPPKGARGGLTFEQQQQALKQGQAVQQQGQEQQGQQQQAALVLPCERADHVMLCWRYCDDGLWKDLLVVFGGSCSSGLLNDTWLFDINTASWSQAFCGGAAPCPRSSCAAAISGDILLLHGGQTPAGVLHDMHLLNLSTLTWLQVDLGPVLQPLCRHSMVVSGSSCLIFGGYDGSTCNSTLLHIDLQPVQQLQRSSLQDLANSMACCGSAVLAPAVKVLSKKARPPPLKLSDLPNAEEVSQMPQWKQVRQLHQAALAAGCDQYFDPKTGYTVFTAGYLGQRKCCGNKCRHCPHGWSNVKKERLQPPAAALDW